MKLNIGIGTDKNKKKNSNGDSNWNWKNLIIEVHSSISIGGRNGIIKIQKHKIIKIVT